MNRLYQRKLVLTAWAVVATTVAAASRCRAAEDPMDQAVDRIVAFDWDKAYSEFSAIAAASPAKSERWTQATFGAATASCNIQPVSKANADKSIALYESIIADAPQSKYAPRAMMNLARMKELRDYPEDQPDLDGAEKLYLQVAQTWPDRPIAGEATFRAAAALVQAYDAPDFAKVKQGVTLLEAWVASHPNDPMLSMMWHYLGDTYFSPLGDTARANAVAAHTAGDAATEKAETAKMVGYYNKSIACYDKVEALGWTDAGNQGPVLWRVAVISERVGNIPSAIKYYTQSVVETPNSGKAYESQLALKRLGAPVPDFDIYHKAKKANAPATREAAK